MYVCMYVCMCVHTYVCMYVCIRQPRLYIMVQSCFWDCGVFTFLELSIAKHWHSGRKAGTKHWCCYDLHKTVVLFSFSLSLSPSHSPLPPPHCLTLSPPPLSLSLSPSPSPSLPLPLSLSLSPSLSSLSLSPSPLSPSHLHTIVVWGLSDLFTEYLFSCLNSTTARDSQWWTLAHHLSLDFS